MEKIEKKVYVIRPNTDCYYGIKIDKNTKVEFENKFVKQKIENLVLKSKHIVKNEQFKSVTNLEVKLKEGDILLLEEENRGYFLPKDILIGSVDEAIDDLTFLKEQISKIKE